MTLVGLIYMFKTNCDLKRKFSDMLGLCKSLEKTDINTIYGEEYYADGCMEVFMSSQKYQLVKIFQDELFSGAGSQLRVLQHHRGE